MWRQPAANNFMICQNIFSSIIPPIVLCHHHNEGEGIVKTRLHITLRMMLEGLNSPVLGGAPLLTMSAAALCLHRDDS